MGRPSRQQRCNGGKPVSPRVVRAVFSLNTQATLGLVPSTRLLTKRYGSLTAVEDLDLEIAPGELFGFLGPNGAGKTTTIKMLVGLLRPTSGSARLAGIDILAEPEKAKARIGYVPDAATLYDKLSAREFLEFSGDLYHVEPRLRDRRIATLLKLFDLEQRGNDFLSGYSRGMRQKVSLAAALLHDPQVLFLDEPTVGLDPQSARQMSGIDVGLLLWRAQLRMFVNQTLRSGKPGRIVATIIGAAIIVLAWGWEALITTIGVEAARRFHAQVDVAHLLSLAFLGYTAVLVFSSLIFSLNALLLNPDLDLLLAAPRPVASILAGRMVLQVLRLFLLSVLFTGPALLVLAFANHNPLIVIVFCALYLLYPVFVVVIISLMSLLLVRVIPAGRGREILTLFGVAVAVGINLLNFLLNPALRDAGIA